MCPPPPRGQLLDVVDVRGRVHGEQLLARRLRRPHDVAAEPVVRAPSRPRARRSARGRSGWRGHLVGERELVAQPDGPGHADTVGPTCHGPGRPHRRGRRRRRALRRALTAAREGAQRRARSPPARWPRRRPTGPRAGSPPRSPTTTRRSSTSQDTIAAGRGIVRASAARILTEEAPARFRDLERARRALRRRPPRQPRARARGRPLAPPRRPRGRQRDRPPDPARAQRRRRRAPEHRRAARAAARPALRLTRRPRRRASTPTTAARSPPAPSILATGGAAALWSRTTNPPGSFGSGLLLARAAGRHARRPRVRPVPPHRGHRRPAAARASSSPRPCAARARRSTTPSGERFVDELAPRDAGRPRDPRASWTPPDAAPRPPRHAPRRPRALPQRRRGAARGRARPDDRARPGLPRRALRDGRHRHRPPRPHRRRRPLRGRRVRLHRPARRQPARLQLALASASCSAAAPPRAGLDEPAPPSTPAPPAPADVTPPARETREAVWRGAGLERDAEGLHAPARRPAPARPPRRRAQRSRARRAAARTCAGIFRISIPALDGYHSIVTAGDTDVVHEAWD